jgi:hypothetical protein
MLTTEKIGPGTFLVMWNGVATGWEIVNGSLGQSGRDTANVYGILKSGSSPRWIGSLAACKKALALTFRNAENVAK